MSDLIYQIEKNGTEVVRFEVSEFKEKEYINIRIWYQTPGGDFRPTQKGVTLELSKFKELQNGMDKLGEYLKDRDQNIIPDQPSDLKLGGELGEEENDEEDEKDEN